MLTRNAVSALCMLLLADAALAQSNSLFRKGRGAAASQPAGPAGAMAGPLIPGALPSEQPPPNPHLLRSSPIAVELPKPRKIQVHDLITIIVREDKRASSDSKLESERQWKVESELAKWFRLAGGNLVAQPLPDAPGVLFDFDNQYDGEGKTERQDSLITRITATVTDVKPNGTLVLEAKKAIATDEDRQIMTLTGVCRALDVTPQNTVLSTQLADAQIDVQHTGPARDASRRGWLMRFFDLLRPL